MPNSAFYSRSVNASYPKSNTFSYSHVVCALLPVLSFAPVVPWPSLVLVSAVAPLVFVSSFPAASGVN